MSSLQTVVAYCPRGSQPYMRDRRPAFQFVVPVAVKHIRHAGGQTRGAGFHGGEGGVIVHQIIRQKISPAVRGAENSALRSSPACGTCQLRRIASSALCPRNDALRLPTL